MKKLMFILIGISLMAALTVPLVSADEVDKIPVDVVSDSSDSVGTILVYKVTEGIRASSHLRIADTSVYPRIHVIIQTLDPDEKYNPGLFTAYSIIWTAWTSEKLPPFLQTSTIGTCGVQRVDQTAMGLVADTDKIATRVFKK